MTTPVDDIPLISVIVPVFNEGTNVRPAYEAITAEFEALAGRYRLELLFTDNHSTDGTEAELEALARSDRRVRVIRFTRNFGFQRSVLTGYRNTTGAAAIQIDCDLQDPPAMIPVFLDKWRQGHDVVVGIRRTREEGWFLRKMRATYYRVLNRISDENLIVDGGDFRLVDRQVIDHLRAISDTQPYVRGLISSLAKSQVGVPYDRKARERERSKFSFIPLVRFAADGIFGHSILPLRIATFTGIGVFALAACLMVYYLVVWLTSGTEMPAGFATLALLILFSIGLNGIFVGILGEYIGRVYSQVRHRPLTVVEKRINFDD